MPCVCRGSQSICDGVADIAFGAVRPVGLAFGGWAVPRVCFVGAGSDRGLEGNNCLAAKEGFLTRRQNEGWEGRGEATFALRRWFCRQNLIEKTVSVNLSLFCEGIADTRCFCLDRACMPIFRDGSIVLLY